MTDKSAVPELDGLRADNAALWKEIEDLRVLCVHLSELGGLNRLAWGVALERWNLRRRNHPCGSAHLVGTDEEMRRLRDFGRFCFGVDFGGRDMTVFVEGDPGTSAGDAARGTPSPCEKQEASRQLLVEMRPKRFSVPDELMAVLDPGDSALLSAGGDSVLPRPYVGVRNAYLKAACGSGNFRDFQHLEQIEPDRWSVKKHKPLLGYRFLSSPAVPALESSFSAGLAETGFGPREEIAAVVAPAPEKPPHPHWSTKWKDRS